MSYFRYIVAGINNHALVIKRWKPHMARTIEIMAGTIELISDHYFNDL